MNKEVVYSTQTPDDEAKQEIIRRFNEALNDGKEKEIAEYIGGLLDASDSRNKGQREAARRKLEILADLGVIGKLRAYLVDNVDNQDNQKDINPYSTAGDTVCPRDPEDIRELFGAENPKDIWPYSSSSEEDNNSGFSIVALGADSGELTLDEALTPIDSDLDALVGV